MQKTFSRVSIVVPALNEESCIERAIDSGIQAGAHEIIVADGGSHDRTRSLARALGAVVIQCEPGRAKQQNAGAASAEGEVLLFLHADNWLAPEVVPQIQRASEHVGFTHGAFRQEISAPGRLYRWLEMGNAARVRRRGLPYGDQGIFVRRELFASEGGFPDVPLMEDLILMDRFRRQHGPPLLLDGPLHVDARRWRKHGVIRQTARNWMLVAAYRACVSPQKLADFYRRHDR